jgi:hypothetical protein
MMEKTCSMDLCCSSKPFYLKFDHGEKVASSGVAGLE